MFTSIIIRSMVCIFVSRMTLITVEEDYRKLLIDIFFAVILTVGLDSFLSDFLIKDENMFFSHVWALIDILFFISTFFWVVSHWVFYHELIKKYPYGSGWIK